MDYENDNSYSNTPGIPSEPSGAPAAPPPYLQGEAPGPFPGEYVARPALAPPGGRSVAAHAAPARPARREPRPRSRAMEIALMAISLVIVVFLALFIFSIWAVGSNLGSAFTPSFNNNNPPANTFSVVSVEGTISSSDASYNHASTVEHVKQLTEDAGNTGILLYLNTPGGGVYESDELYRALMHYKEVTGRPVHAYMAATCASGGYYVSMAADSITANYNTTTGSIGVYIALTDTSELYGKIGVRTVLIRSGENKAVGTEGVEITPEQQAVFQSSVDESYERFVSLVADGRGMEPDRARELSDGRIYTANQALENGLVDELGDWDGALEAFEALTGSEPFYPNFSTTSAAGQFFFSLFEALPRGENETALSMAEKLPSGVPLVYAAELAE